VGDKRRHLRLAFGVKIVPAKYDIKDQPEQLP
jgi:hypothetical protein